MHSLLTWLAGAVLLASSTTGAAAIITWGPAEDTTDQTDVVTAGALVEAFNATSIASGSVTINGVDFANTNNLLGSTFVGALSGESSGDPDYNLLLNSFNFGGGPSTTTISIGGSGAGLFSGGSYLVQVWYTDLRTASRTRNMTFGDGEGNNVTLNASGERLGQFAIGQFVADGATQTLSLMPNGFGNSHITGYQIRTNEPPPPLPEPATLLLMGGGLLGLGLAVTRRRRRAAS